MSLPQMSVSGAVLIAVIAVVRALAIHRLPKRVFVLLWGVVLLRLLVPFSIPARISVYSFVPEQTLVHTRDVIPVGGFEPAGRNEASEEKPALDEGTRAPVRNVFPLFSVRVLVWLAGALLTAMFFLVCYVRCRREFAMSLPVKNAFAVHWREEHRRWRDVQIRQSDQIAAPLTYGVFRPVILMPKGTNWGDEGQVSCVLLHEYIHICRFDVLWKLAAAAALCIHWFNPMVWVMYLLLNKDIELSCDERVVRRLGGDARVVYARTLIAMEERKSGLLPLYNSFSRNAIEERIKEIMRAKKLTVGITVASVALVAVIAGVFATSAKADESRDAVAQVQDNADKSEGDALANVDELEADVLASADESEGDALANADKSEKDASVIADEPERDASMNADETKGDAMTDDSSEANGTQGGAAADAAGAAEKSAKMLVYVKALDGGTLTFDEIEWVEVPGVRAEELGFTEDDAPNGFSIYNETTRIEELPVAAGCTCTILDWKANYEPKEVSLKEFRRVLAERVEQLEEAADQDGWMITPYHLTVEDGQIVDIHEQYVP